METAVSDEQIIEQALTGDADAFGEIVRRWERRIYALTYGMLGREDDARDAQSAWISRRCESFFMAAPHCD
jgi:DNA-directed RNA polymerase specialized sigma24 family protein